MEVRLVNRETDFYKCNLDTMVQQEETLEIIVPDSMPDVGRILFVSGTVLMRSKEATDGRVSVTGVVNLSAVYMPEDGGHARRVEAALPFTVGTESAEIRGGDRIVAVASLAAGDARALNPRKLLFRADVLTHIQVYGEQRLSLACPAEETEGLELLLEKRELELMVDVREKTFVISDEFPIPAGKPELEEILKVSAELSAGECKAVGSKLIFKGEARIDLLYAAREDGSLCHADFNAGFSQVIEMADGDGERSFDVSLMLTGAYFEAAEPEKEGRRVLMELHMVAQATAREKREVEYIADAYCPRWELEQESQTCTVDCGGARRRIGDSGRASLQTPTVPARVLGAELRLGRCRMEEEKLFLAVGAAIVYVGEDGGLSGVTGRFELSCDCPGGGVPLRAWLGEAGISISEMGFDLRLPYEVELEERVQQSFAAISALETREDAPKDLSHLPSLVLVRGGQEKLWDLAKRYGSSRSLICAANGFEEAPKNGAVILIPKMR